MSRIPHRDLNDGTYIPQIGFGTWPLSDEEAVVSVTEALAAGHRLIDTASSYGNESGVGLAIRASGLPRETISVTTKLRGADQGYDEALRGFEASATRLGLDYVDLYLIHWPLPQKDLFVESWRALGRLRDERRVRSIGVSNFQPHHIDRLVAETGIVPSVNQIELHLAFAQRDLLRYDDTRHIVTEAWSPLGRGDDFLHNEIMSGLTRKYGKSAAQIALRWHVETGTVPLPRSRTPAHIRADVDIFDFMFAPEDLRKLASLDRGLRFGGDPETWTEE